MGFRNGELVSDLAPGRNGPSDIDHVIHNKNFRPQRVVFLEYKGEGVPVPRGQQIIHESLSGIWQEVKPDKLADVGYGKLVEIKFVVVRPSERQLLIEAVRWVWPEVPEA